MKALSEYITEAVVKLDRRDKKLADDCVADYLDVKRAVKKYREKFTKVVKSQFDNIRRIDIDEYTDYVKIYIELSDRDRSYLKGYISSDEVSIDDFDDVDMSSESHTVFSTIRDQMTEGDLVPTDLFAAYAKYNDSVDALRAAISTESDEDEQHAKDILNYLHDLCRAKKIVDGPADFNVRW